MPLRKLLIRLLPLISTLAIFAGGVAAFTAAPSGTAEACNPCDCPSDKRINCQGIQFYGIYTYERGDVCYIDAYRMQSNGSPGRRAWRVTSRDLADLPEAPEENTLITSGDAIFLYQLTTGELQVNAGPAEDGKIYVTIWQGCPADQRTESSFVPGS
ncbi:MAG: hypothetical protein KJ065_05915 [Anaerolineae bacterium]|nr:hypothetical protein [Anaerolineae bacterium]